LPIATAARAPGKMKIYEFPLGCIQIAIFVVSWLVLMMGGAAYMVFVVAIVANLVMFIIRLLIVRTMIGLSIRSFFCQVIKPVLMVALLSTLFSFIIHWILPEGLIFVCLSVLASMIISCVSMYFVGLEKLERKKVRSMIINRINEMPFHNKKNRNDYQ
jgi:hypothetical protein